MTQRAIKKLFLCAAGLLAVITTSTALSSAQEIMPGERKKVTLAAATNYAQLLQYLNESGPSPKAIRKTYELQSRTTSSAKMYGVRSRSTRELLNKNGSTRNPRNLFSVPTGKLNFREFMGISSHSTSADLNRAGPRRTYDNLFGPRRARLSASKLYGVRETNGSSVLNKSHRPTKGPAFYGFGRTDMSSTARYGVSRSNSDQMFGSKRIRNSNDRMFGVTRQATRMRSASGVRNTTMKNLMNRSGPRPKLFRSRRAY